MRLRALLAAVMVLVLAGCGGTGATHSSFTTTSVISQAQRNHEYPSPPPPPETTSGTASGPVQALRAFASAYINWSADTVSADMRMLARESVGQARSAMQLAAAQTAQDYELQRAGIANSGTVQAIAPLLGAGGQYVVVTREQTTATATTAYQGLRPAWHLAVAAVAQMGNGRWVVSKWQPEN